MAQEKMTEQQAADQLEEQNLRIAQLESALKAEQAKVKMVAGRNAGWLVTAPNQLFSGTKFGIAFVYGQAFIPETLEVEYFKGDVVPLSTGQLDRFLKNQMPIPPYTAADHANYKKEYKARQKTLAFSTSFRAVVHLHQDFGYKAVRYEPDQIVELEVAMKVRADEARGVFESEELGREQTKKLIEPGYFGQPAA